MLFFMGAASHLPLGITADTSLKTTALILAVIIGGLEANAIFGKLGLMKSVKGVIHCGLVLAAVLYLAIILTV
jgi:hypothetical protein